MLGVLGATARAIRIPGFKMAATTLARNPFYKPAVQRAADVAKEQDPYSSCSCT